jgi:hypothetical protein
VAVQVGPAAVGGAGGLGQHVISSLSCRHVCMTAFRSLHRVYLCFPLLMQHALV